MHIIINAQKSCLDFVVEQEMCKFLLIADNTAVQSQKRVTAILTLSSYAFLPLDGRILSTGAFVPNAPWICQQGSQI